MITKGKFTFSGQERAATIGAVVAGVIGAAAVGALSGVLEANYHFAANGSHNMWQWENAIIPQPQGMHLSEPVLPEPVDIGLSVLGGALGGYVGGAVLLGGVGGKAGEAIYNATHEV